MSFDLISDLLFKKKKKKIQLTYGTTQELHMMYGAPITTINFISSSITVQTVCCTQHGCSLDVQHNLY